MVNSNSAYCKPEAVTGDTTASEFAETIAADPVAEFYTDHPYPPPVENLDRARDEWRDEKRLRAEYHLVWPNRAYRADLNILVAGCGTWQAAKYALCRPGARVTGIDVSTTSLDHTERLKQKYRLTNLQTERLPIERAAELGHRFDLVVCTGVLHHLADPDDGLAALRSVLAPDGAIYLMVYAPYGRAGVYLLQEYCRRLGVGTSTQEINDLATVVKALSPHHPLASLLRSSRDALDPDALADALLNPRDRAYSVPQLLNLVERNGLEFGRWYWQGPYLPQCGSIAPTPHAKRLAQLPERELYAAMELWRGTMTAHSAVLYGSAAGARGQKFSFADDRWRDYVPYRLPNTLCVTERLPRGAAGVLLNRSHPFHDLIVIVDPAEKRLFDAIDGHRSVADIVDRARVGSLDARKFVEKLWQYDQIVFDASKA